MKKLLLLCFAFSLLLFVVGLAVAADSTTVNGTVSDSMCGAKGAKAVIVTDGDGKVLTVDNADVLKGHEGHHVAVTGTVTGESVHIDSVKML